MDFCQDVPCLAEWINRHRGFCRLLVLQNSCTLFPWGSCFGKLEERAGSCRDRWTMGKGTEDVKDKVDAPSKAVFSAFPISCLMLLRWIYLLSAWAVRVYVYSFSSCASFRVQPIPTLVDLLIPTCPWRTTGRRLGVKPSARLSCSWKGPRWEHRSRQFDAFTFTFRLRESRTNKTGLLVLFVNLIYLSRRFLLLLF